MRSTDTVGHNLSFSSCAISYSHVRAVPTAGLGSEDNNPDFSEYVQQPDENIPYLPDQSLDSLQQHLAQRDHSEQHGHHDAPDDHHNGEIQTRDNVTAEYWDATRLQVESYQDLVERRDEILALLIQQGDSASHSSPCLWFSAELWPSTDAELQRASNDAIEASLVDKQPSWVKLLRRSFHLYSASCQKLGIPTHPICAPKVALYLSRLDEDPNGGSGGASDDPDATIEPDVAVPSPPSPPPPSTSHHHHHQPPDLPVSPDSVTIDPSLASTTASTSLHPYNPTPPPPAAPKKAKKGRKVLRRKTLEQYVNRLTAIRTPTLDIWKPRCGIEWETNSGLGMAPVVRDICRRAEGESAMEVKKRGRQAKGGQGKASKKAKKDHDGGDIDLQVDVEGDIMLAQEMVTTIDALENSKGELPTGIIQDDLGVEEHEDGPSNDDLAAAVQAVHRHFVVTSSSDSSSSFRVTCTSSSSDTSFLAFPNLQSLLPPHPATTDDSPPTYSLSPEAFKQAEAFVRALQDGAFEGEGGLNQQMIGDIARSVEAAQAEQIPYGAFARAEAEGEMEIEIDPSLT
ncbi:hypothetical protein P7C70_g1412, partial [Phenoliferia sp. Uapishka_3]